MCTILTDAPLLIPYAGAAQKGDEEEFSVSFLKAPLNLLLISKIGGRVHV